MSSSEKRTRSYRLEIPHVQFLVAVVTTIVRAEPTWLLEYACWLLRNIARELMCATKNTVGTEQPRHCVLIVFLEHVPW